MNARYRITGGGGVLGGGERGMREVCASQGNGSATPGYRVKKFIDAFPNHTTYSICQNDFREAMQKIGEKIRATVGPPCVDRPLVDIELMTPTTRMNAMTLSDVDCNVQERIPLGNGQYEERVVPSCAANRDGPCWNIRADGQCGGSAPVVRDMQGNLRYITDGQGRLPGYMIEIDRKGEMPVEGTQQSIRCLTHVDAILPN
jgi:hypothetical protein